MILKENDYNPKIDYLFCKSFLSLPNIYDEFELRNIFKYEVGHKEYEQKLIMIKRIFKFKNINDFNDNDWNILLEIILERRINIIFNVIDINNINHIFKYFKELLLNYSFEESTTILHVMLVYSYFNINKRLLIFHQNRMIKFCQALERDNLNISKIILSKTLDKQLRYFHKHSIVENINLKNNLLIYSKECKEKFNLKGIGIYGSFSLNHDNEYSDLDILVIVNDEVIDYKNLKQKLYQYWNSKTKLDLDIKIIKSFEFELESIAVKKSLNYYKEN